MPGTTAAQIAAVFLIYFSDKINSIIVLAGDTCELGLWFRPCFAIFSFDENSSTIHQVSHVGISQNMAYATTPQLVLVSPVAQNFLLSLIGMLNFRPFRQREHSFPRSEFTLDFEALNTTCEQPVSAITNLYFTT